MKKTVLAPFALLLAAFTLTGCVSDGGILLVKVYVHDKDGLPSKGATVYAYDSYSFGSVDPVTKWLSLKDPNIVASRETDSTGNAFMNLGPGKYAFFARAQNGQYGGSEQYVSIDGEKVEITVAAPATQGTKPQ